jgi:hypothetical protein
MNRSSSTLFALPAALALFLGASCKGPGKEPAASDFAFDFESEAEQDFTTSASVSPRASEPRVSVQEEAAEAAPPERLDYALGEDAREGRWTVESLMLQREEQKPRIRENYVFLLAGVRDLADEAWEPVEQPATGGITYFASGPGGHFHWDVGFHYGGDSGQLFDGTEYTRLDSTVWELDAGLVKIFALGSVLRPYIGAGVCYLRASGTVNSSAGVVEDSDYSFGGYARAGLALAVTRWGGLFGVDVRYIAGTSVNLGTVETDVDGLVASISLGFSW